ncbi:Hint domain-containing protein [Aliiroseovarius crassostreae]|nr:Hint domain-containing protein [Aliiroseovarius crassostreae]
MIFHLPGKIVALNRLLAYRQYLKSSAPQEGKNKDAGGVPMTFQTRGLVSAYDRQARHIYSSGIGADARVLTLSGEKPITEIKAGERLVAADVGVVRLRAISRKTMHLQDMIRINPTAMFGMSGKDAFHVAPNQPILLRGWMAKAMFGKEQTLVAAHCLVDGELFSRPTGAGTVTLFQLHFAKRHLIRINGRDMSSTPLPALKGA